MKRWKIILSFVVVFLAGAVVGGAVAARFAYETFLSPPAPDVMSARMVKRLQSDLDLTAEQIPKVAAVAWKTSHAMSSTQHEMFDRFNATLDSGDAEVAALLTPDQRKKFEEIVAKRRSLMKPH